jgi:sigma-E factor negative regulatory protein RseA
MERISQLMDGELGAHESRLQLRRLEQDGELVQAWATYHLIRDVLRDEAGVSAGFAQRVCDRLRQEPAVIAPQSRLIAGVVRHRLPLAAAVAGIAIVGWLALTPLPPVARAPSLMTENAVPPAGKEAPRAVPRPVALADAQMNEYLLAHQEYSPTTAIQGVASYVRTVSNEDPDSSR